MPETSVTLSISLTHFGVGDTTEARGRDGENYKVTVVSRKESLPNPTNSLLRVEARRIRDGALFSSLRGAWRFDFGRVRFLRVATASEREASVEELVKSSEERI